MDLTGELIDNRYKVIERMGEGGMSVIWLAQDTKADEQLVIKVLKEESTSQRVEDVIRFRREASAIAKLLHKNIVRTFAIGEYNGSSYIVMELIKGKSLSSLLEEKAFFTHKQIVEMISGVCSALEYVHGLGVIHRDLKPGNIMIVPGDGSETERSFIPKLIDFGLAELREFSHRRQEEIVGTFSYMSPEQSGITGKPVDERSDLYSLGVLFYQLLTGELPFRGKDISQLLHQQVAKAPDPPGKLKEDIPKVLEEIVLKLLKKEQEERYQSAKGLSADLKRYQEGETDFVLGKEDRLVRLAFRTRLIGREEEISKLKDLLNQTGRGKGRVCLIRGKAGSGKTRLAEELRGYVYGKRGIFVRGRCFDQENKIPYQPFKEALDEYIHTIQKMKEEERERVIGRVKEGVGEWGEIVVRLNPLMKEILGDVPPLVQLQSDRETKRFLMICSRLFRNLGHPENPVVVLLDDLQWSDEGSLLLLGEIVKDIGRSPLLIVGTYREDELTSTHSLMRLKREAEERGLPLEEIPVRPFDYPCMNRLVANLLFEDEGNTKEISRYLLEKSRGNPFFAIETLRLLVDQKVVFHQKGCWVTNLQRLGEIEISPTILDIVIRRIALLEETEISLLSYAAVIGREFELELLFGLTELRKEKVVSIVDRAIELQLLERSLGERGKVLFVHDRIKDAFYQKIGRKKRAQLHLEIAKAIEGKNREGLFGVIFDLAHHYTEGGDKDKSLEYALPAAQRAKEGYANEEAIRYFTLAKGLLEEKGGKGSKEWIETAEGLGEVYLRIVKSDDAIEVLNEILPFKVENIEKARVYKQLSAAYFKKGDWHNCEVQGRAGLRLLGEYFPITKAGVVLGLAKELFVHILHSLFPRIFDLREGRQADEKYPLMMWIYYSLIWMYVLSDTDNFLRCVLRILNIAERRIGRSKELGMSIGAYASVCMAIPLFKRALRYHEKGLRLKEELGDEWGVAQSLQIIGFYYLWKGEYEKSIHYSQESLDRFRKIGDTREMEISLHGLYSNYFYSSDYRRGIDLVYRRLEITQDIIEYYGISNSKEWLSRFYIEMGEYAKAEENAKKSLALSEEREILLMSCVANINLGYLNLERGNPHDAIQFLEKAKILNETNSFVKDFVVFLYTYLAEASIMKYLLEEKDIPAREKRLGLKKIKKACRDALGQTKSWKNHYGGALRVQGKYYALIGKKRRAEKLFLRSIEQCRKLDRKYEQAKGYYEYGKYFDLKGEKTKAKECWLKAYEIFKKIDSKIYRKRTEELIGLKEESASLQRLMDKRRLSSVIEISQYIGLLSDLDDLVDRIMEKAIEVSGAQRGYLFIRNSETDKLELRSPRDISSSEVPVYSKHIVDEVYNSGAPVITTNAEMDEKYSGYQSIRDFGLKSILCVPMKYQKKIIGVCYLDNPVVSSVFTQEDAEVLNVFIAQAAIAIENSSLYQKERLHQQKLFHMDKLVTLGTISSGVAHEINNPLNNIMVNSNLLLKLYHYMKPILDEYYKEKGDFYLGSYKYSEIENDFETLFCGIINGSKRIKRIVEDLKRFSKKEIEANSEPVDTREVVESSLLLMSNLIKESTDNFKVEYGSELPRVRGNFQRLEQAVVNLIQNACHALRKKKEGIFINVSLNERNSKVVIEVKDEGRGMDGKTLTQSTDPFFTTKHSSGGTGLGLYITDTIIKEHGGELRLISAQNGGTTARIALPVYGEHNQL